MGGDSGGNRGGDSAGAHVGLHVCGVLHGVATLGPTLQKHTIGMQLCLAWCCDLGSDCAGAHSFCADAQFLIIFRQTILFVGTHATSNVTCYIKYLSLSESKRILGNHREIIENHWTFQGK